MQIVPRGILSNIRPSGGFGAQLSGYILAHVGILLLCGCRKIKQFLSAQETDGKGRRGVFLCQISG
jgi:hypothetical protein